MVKVLAFLLVGFVGASIGATLGAQYLPSGGYLLGVLLGFVLGGLVGLALIVLGIGLAFGYAGYLVALDFGATHFIALLVGVGLFIVGAAFSREVLSVVTAMAGGLLLFDVLAAYGLGALLSIMVAGVLTVTGLWIQMGLKAHPAKRTAAPAGGQPK